MVAIAPSTVHEVDLTLEDSARDDNIFDQPKASGNTQVGLLFPCCVPVVSVLDFSLTLFSSNTIMTNV